jgi:coenzyme PQQ biosynthesis protein PqqD
MITLESHPQQRERIFSQQASGTLVLLNPGNGEYYALNEVGSRVWELCDGTRSVSEMISAICREYDAPTETIEADVLALLAGLVDENLLVGDR